MPHDLVETPVRRGADSVPRWSLLAGVLPLVAVAVVLLLLLWLTRGRRRRSPVAGSSEAMSPPDTVSALFPNRPIRPLPKRRLRERLSPDEADAIEYPPAPTSSPSFLLYPYNAKDDEPEAASVVNRERAAYTIAGRRAGIEAGDAEAATVAARGLAAARPSTSLPARSGRPPRPDHSRVLNALAATSASSSADGYDSLENTNNKKKRKIPTAGDVSLNGGHISDVTSAGGSLATSSPAHETHGDGSSSTSSMNHASNGFPSGSPGISGPGRGRYGRTRSGRSPLRTLSDASSNWAGRNGKLRPTQWSSQSAAGEGGGIISSAIANAKLPPQQGQENVSLLQQQPSAKSSPASTQFTFTCDSQVPRNLTWPDPDHKVTPAQIQQRSGGGGGLVHWHQSGGPSNDPNSQPHTQAGISSGSIRFSGPAGAASGEGVAAAGKKKRSSRSKLNRELDDQARARKRDQEAYNYQNPPADDMYICPFCEFESINGYKPRVLIRAFEMKERKKRLEAERRQRLLEKAKARGRKGKRGKLPAAKPNVADGQATPGQHGPPIQPSHSQETRSDEYDDDDYGDDGDGYDPNSPHFAHHHDLHDPGLHGGGGGAALGGHTGAGSGHGHAHAQFASIAAT